PQTWLSSFPNHALRNLLFRGAPIARRFVSGSRLSLHHLGKPAAQRCLVSCVRASQTSPAVAPLPASPISALHRQRPLQCAEFPPQWLPLSPYETVQSRQSI